MSPCVRGCLHQKGHNSKHIEADPFWGSTNDMPRRPSRQLPLFTAARLNQLGMSSCRLPWPWTGRIAVSSLVGLGGMDYRHRDPLCHFQVHILICICINVGKRGTSKKLE